MRHLVLLWLAGLAMAVLPLRATAQEYRALLIGNERYDEKVTPGLGPIVTAPRDLALMKSYLLGIGFRDADISVISNARYPEMSEAIRQLGDWATRAPPGSVALLLYTGHGNEYDGVNYLIPVDGAIRRRDDLATRAVSLTTALRHLGHKKDVLRIVILDMCRTLPSFPDDPVGTASGAGGRPVLAAPGGDWGGTALAFSTDIGLPSYFPRDFGPTANPSGAANSYFIGSLVKNLKSMPGRYFSDVMVQTRHDVMEQTKGRSDGVQRPTLRYDSFNFSLSLAQPDPAVEFDAAMAARDPARMAAWLARHPEHVRTDAAKKLIAEWTSAAPTTMLPSAGRMIDMASSATGSDPQRQLKLLLRTSSGVIVAPALENYLNRILVNLLGGWSGQKPPMRIRVTADDDYALDGAPDGSIVFTSGMLRQIRIEDEAAFIVAYQAAHMLLDHQRDRAAINELTRDATAAINLGLQVATVIGGSQGKTQSTTINAVRQMVAIEPRTLMTRSLIFRPWTREQQERADALAVDLMVKAGYSIIGASRVFATMMLRDKYLAENSKKTVEKTEKMTQIVVGDKNKHGFYVDNYFQSVIAHIKVDAKILADGAGRRWDENVRREENLLNYADREYSNFRPALSERAWTAAMQDPVTARILQTMSALDEAVAAKDARTQQRLVRDAMSREAANQPVFLTRVAEIDGLRGDIRSQYEKLVLVAGQPLAPMVVFLQLSEFHLARGETEQALAFADQAASRFDDPPALLPVRIALRKRLGHDKDVSVLMASCEAIGDPAVGRSCRQARETGQLALLGGN